ncbi:MAG: ATP-binding protein [Hyphomicrobiales bacterium]
MDFSFEIEGGDFTNAGQASSQIKKILKQLNVNVKIIRKTVIALYEAEVNVVAHAYKGVITANINPEKINIKIQDEGPGIENIDMAMTKGFSTASQKVREMGFGAGMGLPNIKANTNELNVSSVLGKGTLVEFTNYLI